MQTRPFEITDVLTITTGRLISTRGIIGAYDIISFMTGYGPLVIPRIPKSAFEKCKAHLLEQFPQLNSLEMQSALSNLVTKLEDPNSRGEKNRVLFGWIYQLTSGTYGITFDHVLNVKPLPTMPQSDEPDR